LSGEAGELVDGFKKHLIYGKPVDIANLIEECGDVLWYMALLFRSIGVSFESVMEMNIQKLQVRYPDKYTDAHAVARADKKDGE
jgi:NTP pyrophosphatase (non-canonical NTP hydrolase)